MKTCTKCLITKEVHLFAKNKDTKDGFKCNCKSCDRDYRQRNSEKIKKDKQIYNEINKKEISLKRKKYYEENKDLFRQRAKEYRKNNADKIAIRQRRYRERNREKLNAYEKHRRSIDPTFKLIRSLRCRIREALKKNKKSFSTIDLLGASIEQVRQHIESQFTDGMSWENHGAWHIDHIRPCSSFDLTNQEQQRICFHYSNLQPLWATDNLRKSDNY